MFGFLNSDLVTLVIGTFALPFARGFSLFESFSHPFSQTFTFGFIVLGKEFLGSLDFCPRRFFLLELKGLPLAAAVTRPLSL